MGEQLQEQGVLCPRPCKRRRLLGGEEHLVRAEGELAGSDDESLFTNEELSTSDEETSGCDSSDESESEKAGAELERPRNNRWGVAFRRAERHPWTDAQWVAYWREAGFFLTPGDPFPLIGFGGPKSARFD